MSLDKAEAVPVDTHVWQIAKRDYNCAFGNGQKSLTDKVHRDIGWFAPHCCYWMFCDLQFRYSVSILTDAHFHRGLFQEAVGSVCRMGSFSECCPLLSTSWLLVICHNQRVLLFQVLFCSDLKKFQKLKEASHGEHCKIEDSEAEMRKEEPSIKTE